MDKPIYRGRGPKIPKNVIFVITKVYSEHRDWKAQQIMEEVHGQLSKDGMQRRQGWPGLSAIQKELAGIRKRDAERLLESKGLDRPWSIYTLAEYEISPEALPAVMKAWASRLEQGKPLSIRQARWIARLYYVLRDTGNPNYPKHAQIRDQAPLTIASAEKALELLNKYPDEQEDMWWSWQDDAFIYSLMTGDNKPLAKVTEQIRKQVQEVKVLTTKEGKEANNERPHTSKG